MRRRAIRRAWAIALCTSFGIHGVLAAGLAMLPTPEARRAVETRIDVQIAPEAATELVRERSATAMPAAATAAELSGAAIALDASVAAHGDEEAPRAVDVAALIAPGAAAGEAAREGGQPVPAQAASPEPQRPGTAAPQQVAAAPREAGEALADDGEAGTELRGSIDAVGMAAIAPPEGAEVSGGSAAPAPATGPEGAVTVAPGVDTGAEVAAAPAVAAIATVPGAAPAEMQPVAAPAPAAVAGTAPAGAAVQASPAGTIVPAPAATVEGGGGNLVARIEAPAVVPDRLAPAATVVPHGGVAMGEGRQAGPAATATASPVAPARVATVAPGSGNPAIAPRGGIAMGDGGGAGGRVAIAGTPAAPVTISPVAVAPVGSEAEPASVAPAGAEARQSRDVAVLVPARPDVPDAPSRLIDPRQRIVEHLSGYEGGDCFLAVPSGGAGALAVDGLGATQGELARLAAELSEAAAVTVAVEANMVTRDQCGVLSQVRALSPHSVPQIGITPDRRTIASGAALTGRIEKPARRFLDLLLVDDTGTVQRFRNLVDNGDGTVGFHAPMTLIGDAVPTPQLLVAVASDEKLATLTTHEGLHADRYFAALADEVRRAGGAVEFGVTYFFVR